MTPKRNDAKATGKVIDLMVALRQSLAGSPVTGVETSDPVIDAVLVDESIPDTIDPVEDGRIKAAIDRATADFTLLEQDKRGLRR